MKTSKAANKAAKKYSPKWIFLGIVVLIYLSVYFFQADKMLPILNAYLKLIIKILPVFIFVYLLMLFSNYFANKEVLQKHMGESGTIKGWLIAIIAGIASAGPIYMWYPLMKDLKSKGVEDRFIATFLFNRGIKLQWLPILLAYFGIIYSLVLLVVMALVSIPQGLITEKLVSLSNTKD